MSREAILVANSITYIRDTQKSLPSNLLKRVINQFADILAHLPQKYAFHTSQAIDQSPVVVRNIVERAAQRAQSTKSLLLFYYLGHGFLSEDNELCFVHPGGKRGQYETLTFAAVQASLRDITPVRKTLFVLDCCFAGAAARKFNLAFTGGEHCLLASTTGTTRAYLHYRKTDPPIGTFTRTLFDGFFKSEACVSATNNHITADSLFLYAEGETLQLTDNVQRPYRYGHVAEPLSEYVPVPQIKRGISQGLNEKTGYSKLVSICTTLARRSNWNDVNQLYEMVLKHHESAFLTGYKDADGRIEYRPSHARVVLRYIGLLRELSFVERDVLRLTRFGRSALTKDATTYNEKLLSAIDQFLSRRNLNRENLNDALMRVLNRRRLPSLSEIYTDLSLAGNRLARRELGLILDLLSCIGALRGSREPIYFPWQ